MSSTRFRHTIHTVCVFSDSDNRIKNKSVTFTGHVIQKLYRQRGESSEVHVYKFDSLLWLPHSHVLPFVHCFLFFASIFFFRLRWFHFILQSKFSSLVLFWPTRQHFKIRVNTSIFGIAKGNLEKIKLYQRKTIRFSGHRISSSLHTFQLFFLFLLRLFELKDIWYGHKATK